MLQTDGMNTRLIQSKGGSKCYQKIQLYKNILKLLASFKIQIINILIKLFFLFERDQVSFLSCSSKLCQWKLVCCQF